jgi:hypothetical protein
MPAVALATLAAVNSSIAAANAARAAAAAEEAHRAACVSVEQTYSPQLASTGAKQQYAECIQTLYPVQSDTPMPIGLRVSLLGALIICAVATCVGTWKGFNEGGVLDAFMFGLMGLLMSACTLGLIGGAVAGFVYLLS